MRRKLIVLLCMIITLNVCFSQGVITRKSKSGSTKSYTSVSGKNKKATSKTSGSKKTKNSGNTAGKSSKKKTARRNTKKKAGSSKNELEFQITLASGDYLDYPYIDLGLPSGNKWAIYNLGADDIDELGLLFQWGNIFPTADAEEESNLNGISIYDIQGNIKYDAATYHLEGKWKIPNIEDFQELWDYCDWYIESDDGDPLFIDEQLCIVGFGPNGNAIVFPYDLIDLDEDGFFLIGNSFWTSKPYSSSKTDAAIFDVFRGEVSGTDRDDVLLIRSIFK